MLMQFPKFWASMKYIFQCSTILFVVKVKMKRSRQEYKRKWITSRRTPADQHNDSSSEEYSTTQQMHRQTKTLPEETNLFVQEPSSSHAEFQINENNQDNSSSDRHIDKDITSGRRHRCVEYSGCSSLYFFRI
jgi:hypothetical protein